MSRTEIIEELEGLGLHYSRPSRSPEEHERFLRDYLEDLQGFPVQAIRSACKSWRQSEAIRFPKPGELLAFVRRATPSGASIGKPEVFRELTREEYEALPLSEKVRHHRIIAARCRRKAGPMWTNHGTPRALTPEECSPTWHTWRAQADHHEDEASRLGAKLLEAKRRGERMAAE